MKNYILKLKINITSIFIQTNPLNLILLFRSALERASLIKLLTRIKHGSIPRI